MNWLQVAGARAPRVLKWLGIALVSVLLFVAAVLAAANLYLNTDSGRLRLQSTLSDVLHQEVQIGRLRLNLLRGLSVGEVSIRDPGEFRDAPLASIGALDLRYRLAGLAHGVLTVESLSIDEPEIAIVSRGHKWNFSSLSSPPPAEPAPSPAPTPTLAPRAAKPFALPIAVRIEALTIQNLKARFSMDDKMAARIEKVGIGLTGAAEGSGATATLALGTGGEPTVDFLTEGGQGLHVRNGVDLKAKIDSRDLRTFAVKLDLGLPSATISLGKEIRPGEVSVRMDASIDLDTGDASVAALHVKQGDALEIETAGALGTLFTEPRADVTIEKGRISLDRLIPVAKEFLPEIRGAGEIRMDAFHIAGPLDGGREGDPLRIAGRMKLEGLAMSLPALGIEAEGVDGDIDIQGVEVVHFLPRRLENRVVLKVASAAAAGARVKGLSLQANGRAGGVDLSETSADLALTVEGASYAHPRLGRIEAPPLSVQATATGNFPAGRIAASSMDLGLGKALHVKTQASIDDFGTSAISAKTEVTISLADCLLLVPPAIARDLGRIAAGGTMSISVDASGKLASAGSPSSLAASGKLGIKGMSASLAKIPASVKGLGGEIAFMGEASVEKGPGPATARGKLAWGAAAGPSDLSIGKGSVAFDTEIDPALGKVREASATLSVPGLFSLAAKASAEKWGVESLAAEVSLDGVKVDEVLRRLPPPVRKSIAGLSAAASPKVRLAASGRIPKPAEIESGRLPFSATLDLEVPDASASWPDRGIILKKGTMAVHLEARDELVTLGVKTAVQGLGLSGQGWKEPLDASVALALTLDSLDRVTIGKLEAELPGKGFFAQVTGDAAGVKPYLLGREPAVPASLLSKVAAHLRTGVFANLGKGAYAVPGLKIEGSASADVAIELVPSKRASLDAALVFDGLGVEKPPGLAVRGVRGRFPLRKTLRIASQPPSNAQLDDEGKRAEGGFDSDFLYSTLAPLRTEASKITVDEVAAGGFSFRNLFFDTRFQDRSFVVDRFGLDLLRGRLGGSLTTQFTPASNRIEVSTEFAEVNLKALVPFRVEVPDEEAMVDGDMRLTIAAKRSEGGGKVGIDDLDAEIHITKIGRKALDQLLLFLDPTESDPSLGTMRTLLWTVQPTIDQVTIPIHNGSLGLTLYYSLNFNLPRFLSGFVGYFVDTRKSLSIFSKDIYGIFGREDVKKALATLGSLAPVLDAIGGGTILIEDSQVLIR